MGIFRFLFFSFCFFSLGFAIALLLCPENNVQGCWSRTKTGDWISVNVEGMTFDRALEVCRHEVFHEIFAECGESHNISFCVSKHEEELYNATISVYNS